MPDQSALPALLERIRNATDADRELLLDAARALLQDDRAPYTWWARFKQLVDAGAFLDAALALCERALPGWGYFIRRDEDGCNAALLYPYASRVTPGSRQHPTSPALALLAALVAAEMEEKMMSDAMTRFSFKVGDRVTHTYCGAGTVTNVDWTTYDGHVRGVTVVYDATNKHGMHSKGVYDENWFVHAQSRLVKLPNDTLNPTTPEPKDA